MIDEILLVLADRFVGLAEAFAIVLFMAFVGERVLELVEPIVKPLLVWLQSKLPVPEGWVMMVFSWLLIGLVVAATELNIFAPFIPRSWIGYLLTAVLGGGGANFLHDLWPHKPKAGA